MRRDKDDPILACRHGPLDRSLPGILTGVSGHPGPGHVSGSRRRLATLGILGGSFLAAIEATIVATAMPTVVAQLGGLAHYGWVFSAYILTSTVTMPVWGKASDLFGRRRLYLASVALFVVGSALCGAATSMVQLVAFRAIQGLGAGGLLPLGMTILGDLYTLKERARTQGYFSGVWGVASIMGPLVGGYLTDQLSWRWVFYLNLPFGLVAAALVGTALVDPNRHEDTTIDYAGAALLMVAIAVLLIALGQTGVRDAVIGGAWLVGLYVAAGILGLAFVVVERRAQDPILPFDLFADPLVATSTLAGFLVGTSMFSAISYVPLFVQAALGGTATQAGQSLTPLLLAWVTMAIATGRLLPRFGFRPLVRVGLVLVCVGYFGLLVVTHGTPRWAMAGVLGVMGLGMGMTMLSLLLVLQQAVPRARLGVATSVAQFTRSVGGAFGVALMGVIIAASLPPGGELDPLRMEGALHRAFMAGAGVTVLALIAGWRMPADGSARLGSFP